MTRAIGIYHGPDVRVGFDLEKLLPYDIREKIVKALKELSKEDGVFAIEYGGIIIGNGEVVE